MPLKNFHSARVRDPDDFLDDKKAWATFELKSGVELVTGKLKEDGMSGPMTAQAYHFDKSKFTVDQAEKWLEKHEVKTILFEPVKEALEMKAEKILHQLVESAVTRSFDKIFEVKWSAKFINDLADDCFAFIKPGGKKDEDGKTVPRSLRSLPYKNEKGEIDKPHLRNALARLPQSDLSDEEKKKAEVVLKKAAKEAGIDEYKKERRWVGEEQEVVSTAVGDGYDMKDSFEEVRDKIRKALVDAGGWGTYPYIVATFPEKVIFTNDTGRYFQIEYTLEGDEDDIKLGQAKELEKQTQFTIKEWLEKFSNPEKLLQEQEVHKAERILAGIEERPSPIEADKKILTEQELREQGLALHESFKG